MRLPRRLWFAVQGNLVCDVLHMLINVLFHDVPAQRYTLVPDIDM